MTAAAKDKPSTIFLIRHSAPDYDTNERVSGINLNGAIDRYDGAKLKNDPEPFRDLRIDTVFSSDMGRSIQSATALFPSARLLASSLYREAEIPVRFPGWIKLPFIYWLATARFMWFLGYSQDAESVTSARTRAHNAAVRLIAHANQYGIAVLVGHGVFNQLVGSQLKKLSWTRLCSNGLGYGSWQQYESDDPP